MDWARAIERNSEALRGIIESLFVMLGLSGGVAMARIPHPLHRAVLRILRPAESAVRRLIVIAARSLVVKPVPSRPMPAGPIMGKGGCFRPSFRLFDTRKCFVFPGEEKPRRRLPRVHVFGSDPRVVALWAARPSPANAAPPPDGLVNALPITRRFLAMKLAFEDLPRQARRMARWRLRRESMPSPRFKSPLRPGPPPGHRKRKVHDVDEVLAECHGLACYAMEPDTS